MGPRYADLRRRVRLTLMCRRGYSKWMLDSQEARTMYLDLLRKHLTRFGDDDFVLIRAARYPVIRQILATLAKHNIRLVRMVPFDMRKRGLGLDWPSVAETMIGMERLTDLQKCIETVLTEDVPGDLVECGVWRGGACILMRAVLAVYGDEKRKVWVADSFAGVPSPDSENYAADKDLRLDLQAEILAVPESIVRGNFDRYGLLDDRVSFLAGWFKDTLPDSPIDSISILRLDGDLYESTIEALGALYPRLSVGGFCIVDDYHAIRACRQAVEDYRKRHSISAPIQEIDGTGILWRKR
jgi:O-methyltransferase